MHFRKVLMASLPATVISGGIGIAMVLTDCGVWALVGQMISMRFFWVLLMWRTSDWWPAWEFSIQSIKQMFGFGSKLMVEGVLTVVLFQERL